MKKLSMFFMMLCVTIVTLANRPPQESFAIHEGHWRCAHGDEANVTILNVGEGHLREAILELLNGHGKKIEDARERPILRISNYKTGPQYDGDPTVTLNEDDIAALELLNNFPAFETIDLQDVNYLDNNGKPIAFTFSNRYVKNLILPDNWTKEEVRTIGSSIGENLGSAISMGKNELNEPTMCCHVQTSNTLTEATDHIFIDEVPNTKIGENINQHNSSMGLLRHLSVTGTPVARDLCNESSVFDADGHYVFNAPADETSTQSFAAVGGGTRELQGTNQKGAFTDITAKLISLDLSDAIIEDQYNEDLIVLNMTGIFGNSLRTMKIPTYAGFNTIPADFFSNQMNSFRQICIPGNIMYIKTRAFTMQSLDHIWTTGDDENIIYDNGVYLKGDEEAHTGDLPRSVDTSLDNTSEGSVLYGTYTLPAGLKLIESHAFKQDNSHVKDVYALSIDAPECHVDAFGANFYHANNTISGKPVDGIITRESYSNNPDNGTFVTMLHYPRECTTPAIQRYTDVTREYSVATNERDGKGATIYYPNQSEMMRAYTQGTYGYLWYAWDDTRDPWTNSIATAGGFGVWTQDGQADANLAYTNNTNTQPSKTDRSFYDVTDGNKLDQPAALQPYYNTVWEGVQLYPQAESTGTGEMRTVIKRDSEGNIIYEAADAGTYIKKGTYTADAEGTYVKAYDVTENPNGDYVKTLVFTEATDGEYYRPYVNSGKWSNDQNLQQDGSYYTYGAEFVEDENGEYVYITGTVWNSAVGANVHYVLASDWQSWMGGGSPKYSLVNVYTLWDGSHDVNTQLYVLSDSYEKWTASAGDVTRYDGNWDGTYSPYASANYTADTRYNVNSYSYVAATDADADKQHYSIAESYVPQNTTLNAPDEIRVDNLLYAEATEEVEIQNPSRSNDYRGWHQFTLTAYATNSNKPFVPYRSYITDNDWWTICLAFDLTKADLITLFGKNGSTAEKDLPYLSKLTYVVRDVEEKNIVLTFSKNLLVYKENVADGQVHGVISDEKGGVADDDIVLHAGVPYLIRPNMQPDTNGNYKRQFDIYFSENDQNSADNALYNRIKASGELEGSDLKGLIYKGIYTVPAYVVNNETGAESVKDEATFTNADASEFTYKSTDTFTYHKQSMSASISSDFCYSFVGTFYVSRMPQYSYFLGWDSEKQKAAFWYCKAAETGKFNWNNETGIICPNFITARQSIEERTNSDFVDAKDLENPAQWKIKLNAGDDFGNASVKNYTTNSQYGFNAPLWSDEATMIIHIDDDSIEQPTYIKGVYNMNGQYMGESMEGLSKGIYIQNGKKIYVK